MEEAGEDEPSYSAEPLVAGTVEELEVVAGAGWTAGERDGTGARSQAVAP
jgi:hypothetical protein